MISDCENYSIVFNGEVYNFKDIQKELLELDYKFVSNSDTEVILYSYKEWGIKCLDKFIGMFAFSIFDKLKSKIILVRDRVGVKPLYYYANENKFMFSSEIKSFHHHPKFEKVLNKEILPYYFQFGYIPEPYSIFKNCYKLKAGHYLEFDTKDLTFNITKYWDISDTYEEEKNNKNEVEILEDIENLLIDSCNLRMVSDVPVGVFLSGGYDSSLVTALLQKNTKEKINTFTIGFYEKEYNEAEHAKKIAEYLGTNHTEYYCTKDDLISIIKDLPFIYDEPFGDSSTLPTIIVSKLAKEKVTVALSADGGDEVFCGYSKYFALNKIDNLFNSKFKKAILKFFINFLSENNVESLNNLLPKNIKQTNIKDKFNKFKRTINTTNQQNMFINASSLVNIIDIKKLLKISDIDFNKTNFSSFNKIENQSVLNKMMLTDYKTFMLDDVLTKVDRATMSVSLEGREPLLDHRIAQYLAKVPDKLKYKNNQGKYLLRKILYKYIPKEMIDKPKSGFNIPLDEWLKKDLKYLIDKYLDNKLIIKDDIFHVSEIEKLKEDFFNLNKSDDINKIWLILMFQMWKEKWL
jgi:asparagine synthase (glutamine-hydrolysing)